MGYRRSIYTLQQPMAPVTFLEAFDFPQMAPNCTDAQRLERLDPGAAVDEQRKNLGAFSLSCRPHR